MGDCVRKWKRNAVVEGSTTGEEVSKRRRLVGSPSSNVELESQSFCVDSASTKVVSPVNSVCSSFCNDHLSASCCSSNESREVVRDNMRLIDLEAKSSETVESIYTNGKFSREMTPSSELCGDSEEMDSLATKPSAASTRRSLPPAKTPPQAEIDELFAIVEKHEQKRFAEKYNYDIVNDVPLEGRYHWIRLKP